MSVTRQGKSVFLFLKSVFVPLLIGGAASLFTRMAMVKFSEVSKPPLSPPGIIFPFVWIVLYTLMGISFYLVVTSEAEHTLVEKAGRRYYAQLALNFLWPTFFFNFQWYLFSFVWLLILWITVLLIVTSFWKISKTAAYLNIPYLVWLTFAGYLNLGIFWLN